MVERKCSQEVERECSTLQERRCSTQLVQKCSHPDQQLGCDLAQVLVQLIQTTSCYLFFPGSIFIFSEMVSVVWYLSAVLWILVPFDNRYLINYSPVET